GVAPDRMNSTIQWATTRPSFDALDAQFATNDSFPLMNHAGLALRSGARAFYFVLADERFVVLSRDRRGKVAEIAASLVNAMRDRFSLRIVESREACSVLLDDFLLTNLRDCPHKSVEVGVIRYENGRPEDQLVGLRYIPPGTLPTSEASASSVLQPI